MNFIDRDYLRVMKPAVRATWRDGKWVFLPVPPLYTYVERPSTPPHRRVMFRDAQEQTV